MKLIKLGSLLLLLIAWSAMSARADVVIYHLSQTGKFIGASNELALRVGGIIILDPDTKQGYTLSTVAARGSKFFTTATFTNTRIYNIVGAKGKTYTVFASSDLNLGAGRDKNQISRGQNVPLAITPARTISFPKVIAGAGGTVNFNGASAFLVEGKATATFSLPDTRAANANGETVDQVYQRIRDGLLAQGYEAFDL